MEPVVLNRNYLSLILPTAIRPILILWPKSNEAEVSRDNIVRLDDLDNLLDILRKLEIGFELRCIPQLQLNQNVPVVKSTDSYEYIIYPRITANNTDLKILNSESNNPEVANGTKTQFLETLQLLIMHHDFTKNNLLLEHSSENQVQLLKYNVAMLEGYLFKSDFFRKPLLDQLLQS
jgi:hypothetical protein